MKVVFDHQIFTGQKVGGISRYFLRIGEQLDNLGVNVRCVSPLHINQYLRESSYDWVLGLGISRYPHKSARAFQALNSSLSSFIVSVINPDIIHETYYTKKPIAPFAKAVRVLTVYDMIHEKYKDSFFSSDVTIKAKRDAVDRADHIIVISHSTKRDLCHYFDVNPDKVTVTHLGYEQFDSMLDAGDHHFHDRPYMLYVGNRYGYKNFNMLLRAFGSNLTLKDQVDLIAFGGGPFTHEEMGLAKSLGISSQSVRHVNGDDRLLGALYEHAAVFVYPSKYEGFGMPPLEAMAHRCPVAVSNTSSLPEVVGDAGEYFDPEDADSVANAIVRILSDSAYRSDLVNRGTERLKQFSWNRCALETIEVYKRIL